jgi:hypothetical protein
MTGLANTILLIMAYSHPVASHDIFRFDLTPWDAPYNAREYSPIYRSYQAAQARLDALRDMTNPEWNYGPERDAAIADAEYRTYVWSKAWGMCDMRFWNTSRRWDAIALRNKIGRIDYFLGKLPSPVPSSDSPVIFPKVP